jgi:hypothetical protein
MFVLPIASVMIDHAYFAQQTPVIVLVGKWFVFFCAGLRLALWGLRQFLQPRFTSETIFGIKGEASLLIRELGVANFALGVVGIISLFKPTFTMPVAIAAGILFGVAGLRHVAEGGKSSQERIAMVSDLFAFVILAIYVVVVAIG